ncbi:hypothetical protein [Actinophytocola sp.]|uniref:hypothetical protein n=1 Tax=Actinophytocola sp. TaxID=1872138 RepID=UPI002D7F3ADD|nr:hypothetical protein [Actinophytocola sp.]HET9141791.1 hypothetical protein [Actinophytocola sp.]
MSGALATERDGFADLVCDDPDWLDAEFEAIIAANFGGRPRRPRTPRPGGPRSGADRPASTSRCAGHAVLPRRYAARERAPPRTAQA